LGKPPAAEHYRDIHSQLTFRKLMNLIAGARMEKATAAGNPCRAKLFLQAGRHSPQLIPTQRNTPPRKRRTC
jgi:hypothetical protein